MSLSVPHLLSSRPYHLQKVCASTFRENKVELGSASLRYYPGSLGVVVRIPLVFVFFFGLVFTSSLPLHLVSLTFLSFYVAFFLL